jgi:hypothetical protein
MALRIRFAYPTGSDLAYSIERLADGLFYDFSTSTFATTPVALTSPLPEDTGEFLGRYKVTLIPTPVAVFANGDYVVTIHDAGLAVTQVAAELAATMVNGDDASVLLTSMTGIAQLNLTVSSGTLASPDKPGPIA